MKKQIQLCALLSIIGSISAFAAGCAVRPAAMEAKSAVIQNHQPFSVSLRTDDAHEDTSFGGPGIPGKRFSEAIRDSILKYGLFRTVLATDTGDYLLEADIVKVGAPAGGFTMTVNMAVRWKLTHLSTGKVVFQQTTFNTCTATVGDAFAGAARERLAEEGAARGNIEEALHRLSQLNLTGKE